MNRYTRLGEDVSADRAARGSVNNAPSYPASNGTHQLDHASFVTPSSASVTGQPQSSELPPESNDAVSPTAAAAAAASTAKPRGYVPSGVSNLSERDRAHLRTISDTTVSSLASGQGGRNVRSPEEPGAVLEEPELVPREVAATPGHDQPEPPASPPVVSPPTSDVMDGPDYLSVRPHGEQQRAGAGGATVSPTSPSRRSVFHESREDMTDVSK